MKISVIIPVYNADNTISRCIESILVQSYPVHEIIVIDDGSTDKTAEKVQGYSGVKYHYQQNQGPSAARNKGVDISSGNFIAFLDSDDYWRSDHIERIIEPFNINPDLKWSASAYIKETKTGNLNIIRLPGRYIDERLTTDFFISTKRIHFLSVISVMIERSLFQTVGGFPEVYSRGEDLSLWLRLAFAEPKLGYSTEPTAVYVSSPDSLTSKINDLKPILQRIIDDYKLLLNQSKATQKLAWPVIKPWLFGVTMKSIKGKDLDNLKKISIVFNDKLSIFYRLVLLIIQWILRYNRKKRYVSQVGI